MPELAYVLRAVDAVLPDAVRRVDIGIGPDGRIAALADEGTLAAPRLVAAAGLLALPGGIDLHVHINTFFGGTTTRDDFFAGTRAALLGGTTTIAQFAIPQPAETSIEAVKRTQHEADDAAVADYAIHGCVVRDTYESSVRDLDELVERGIGTVKIFSAYTDVIGLSLTQIERLLNDAAARGITVFVHAETDELVQQGIADAVARSRLGPDGHALSRTTEAEADAVDKIADLALSRGARVYFVHVSAGASVRILAARRATGQRLLAETCPHYLFLDESVYANRDGQRWICSPPIRGPADRDALWDGLRDRVLDVVSSDHNCFDLAQKDAGSADFRTVPNGLPGIEYRLPLLVGAALDGRLSLQRVAELASEMPARIMGLWPRKGTLMPGADADIVLVDPTSETDLGRGHMATDYSVYDGVKATGRIVAVFRRGTQVVADGEMVADAGSGIRLAVPALAPAGR
jgi:dihydropyrimidinase